VDTDEIGDFGEKVSKTVGEVRGLFARLVNFVLSDY